MRIMATVRVPVDKGNAVVADGTMGQVVQEALARIKPECAYFYLENGRRTMRAVFEMENQVEMVPAFEPLLIQLNAEVELTPVMTAAELEDGFKALM